MLTKRIFNKTDNTTTPYQTSYIVLGYEWFSYHNMYFALHDGGRVRISDGNAWCAAHVATHHFYPLNLTRCTYNFLSRGG